MENTVICAMYLKIADKKYLTQNVYGTRESVLRINPGGSESRAERHFFPTNLNYVRLKD
jgi:hypothetical protein